MLRQILLICLLAAGWPASVSAQVMDGFDDGNYTADPPWTGDDSLFIVNAALQLQSKGTVAKDICLSTASSVSSEAEWTIWCRFNVSPSTSNFCRYYLMSDSANLKGRLNGYYVQFGGVTGNTDSITLYKQKGTTRTRIIGGRPATVSRSNNIVRVKVLRDQAGNWKLYSDTSGGTNYVLEGAGKDAEWMSSNYLGIFIRFTAGNASNYYADDVYAGPVIIDSVPPRIDSVIVISSTRLRIVFNEPVDTTALNAANYVVSNGLGNPLSVSFINGKHNSVLISLAAPLVNGSYQLTVTGIRDLSGNILISRQVGFNYIVFNAKPNDVLMSELFPDPSHSQGLPGQEFIELYNRTPVTVPLKGWSISDGSSTAVLPDVLLPADSFVIICAKAHETLFSSWGRTVGVSSFPTLNNSADKLVLKDEKGLKVHEVSYDLSWYNDPKKSKGGWTLEMINPFDLCKERLNFGASSDPKGGTPGKANSAWSKMPDTAAPVILRIIALSDSVIAVVFNESMDSLSLTGAVVMIGPGSVPVGMKRVAGSAHDTLLIFTALPLGTNTTYELSLKGARDCNQNGMLPATLSFTRFVPAEANAYDVLINELMADPDPVVALPDAEFVELYNRSSKVISLKGWTFRDAVSTAKLPDQLLLPDSFLIIVSGSNQSQFTRYGTVAGVANFPSLGNDGDELTLADHRGRVIHHLAYTSAFYRDNMKKKGGWTLELIDPGNPCGGAQNMTASIHREGGTPGKPNSVKGSAPDHDPPKLLRAYPLNEHQLRLSFNEDLDSTSLGNPWYFKVSNGTVLPVGSALKAPSYRELVLSFDDPFTIQNTYRIVVDSVRDCAGNKIAFDDYADFGIPEPFDSFEIAINEILFNPGPNGSDYVEIVNRTDKMIDLKELFIANADAQNGIKDHYPIAADGWLLFPHAYAVVTSDPSALQRQYFTPYPRNVIRCVLPSFNNKEGKCILVDKQGKRYDQLNYTDKMHFALLDEKHGVSLERIDFNRPSADRSNWTSASSASGFGTPTYRNSQYAAVEGGAELLTISPGVFSPDGDGYNDVVTFSYVLPQPGYAGNLYIYDANGIMVKHLLRNEILGTTGSFSWDGITDRMDKAAIGIYICYFEAYDLEGNISKKKKTFVVAGKL